MLIFVLSENKIGGSEEKDIICMFFSMFLFVSCLNELKAKIFF